MEPVHFWLNDRRVEIGTASPTMTLLRYLRDEAHLVGTKEGCAEGDCGACSVAVLEGGHEGAAALRTVCSCLLFLPMLHGKRVYTVEGLRGPDDPDHHPVQRALADALGSQCGYCTPGVTMALFEACYRDDLDEPWKLDAALSGNLCRCTGYRPIRDAARAVAGTRPDDRFRALSARALDPPPPLAYRAQGQAYFAPASVDLLFDILEAEPAARLVAGGTDLGLEVTKRYAEPPVLVGLEALPELRVLARAETSWRLGAAASLTDLERFARFALPSLERMLRYFGSRQIKNRATLGGNLCTASPIGDLAPVLLSLDARVVLLARSGERRIPLNRFFSGYRRTVLERGEILAAVEVPFAEGGLRVASYKVSKRRELDISTVAAGFAVGVDDAGLVSAVRLAYGGMAATPARAQRTEAALLGRPWTEEEVERAVEHLDEDFAPLSDHRGSAWYRGLVAKNLLRGFFLETERSHAPRLPSRHTATVLVE